MGETRIDLFTKLPDEILELILNQLTSRADLSSITKSSSICAYILDPKKPIFLFPEVLPHLAQYMNKSDLLTFRLVCSEWRQQTDHHLENSEKFNDENYFRRNSPFWPRRSRSITDFMNTMLPYKKNSPKLNPFPGRRAAFGRIRREAPDFEYWDNVDRLLNCFGYELHDCRLDFEDLPFVQFVQMLSQCLLNLQALKRLQLTYFGRPSYFPPISKIDYKIFLPFSFLKHLELNGKYPAIFYSSVIFKYFCSDLKVLKLHQPVPGELSLPNMPLLEVLHVSVSSSADLPRVLPQHLTLLRTISISMYISEEKDFRQLFDHLHVYKDSLKSLEISFDMVHRLVGKVTTNFTQPFIHTFPILNNLKLKNAPFQLLDSLQSFPSLENLECECLEREGLFFPPRSLIEQNETCGVFKIYGYPANQLYSSAIWNVLMHLQSCKLSCYQLCSGRELKYKYSRERYEYLQRSAMY